GQASPEEPAGAAGGEDVDGVLATSPSIGVFWRSPEPGAPPFVELGATVGPGDTLCIVEVMKLMQQVVAEVAGTVTRVHAENGGEVEFGSPLFTIVPAGS
ncbi:MAG: acetyl-CoA carboxylase biotin carboxyl carrier protein subunit, partial [Solirubrobacterales bacterium]|nr:acetyl-CoA carboxylase biotin carboxyl carrier protein subunit [Solirubrobacterales bacterium]